MRYLNIFAVFALCGLAPQAVAVPENQLPRLGDGISAIVSPDTERRLGQAFLRSLRAQAPTSPDPELKDYTEHLIYQLAQHSELYDRRLDVVLIRSSALNAFAAPGGIVGINLGLYLNAMTVHEFVGVLAHELAHLSQRHFARGIEEQKKQTLPYLAALLASAVVMATVGGDAGMAALTTTQGLAQSNAMRYSRGRETEADRIGINTLARADFDPDGMAAMFQRMQRAARFQRRPPEFLLTHPLTERRIADSRNQAAQFPHRDYKDSLEYHLMRTRVVLYAADTPADAVKMFEAELERESTPFPEASRYGLALALSRSGRADEGIFALAPLLAEDPTRLTYVLAEAQLMDAQGLHRQAANRLRRQLAINPGNLAVSIYLADALVGAQLYQEAEGTLEQLAKERPKDPDVWYSLAEVSGLAGDIVGVHRARAEFYQLRGDLHNAMKQLQYALRLVRDNPKLEAKLNQRLRDFMEIREELKG